MNVYIMCDETASGKSPFKPREPVKYPHLAVKHQTSNTLLNQSGNLNRPNQVAASLLEKRLGQKNSPLQCPEWLTDAITT